MLWMQIEGLIPLMFEMLQPKASLCSHKSIRNFCSSTLLKASLMITENEESLSKKLNHKFDGKGLSSSLGGSWVNVIDLDAYARGSPSFGWIDSGM